jgi:hypothetical protein
MLEFDFVKVHLDLPHCIWRVGRYYFQFELDLWSEFKGVLAVPARMHPYDVGLNNIWNVI